MRKRREKIVDLDGAVALREKLDREGKRLVFTNGCFDLLHLGHVDYLEKARMCGDALLLALNSDRSVRELKGIQRPITAEKARQELMAALECVDAVLVFDSLRVDGVIEQVRPHIYTKGGDYTVETLVQTERAAVETAGGKIEIIPFVPGYSSSNTIERLGEVALAEDGKRRQGAIRHLFLDRDGVLNREAGHITSPERLEIAPGAPEAVARLQAAGIHCTVITNQSGLARGLITEEDLAAIHAKLDGALEEAGGALQGIYVAPWHPDTALEGGNPKYLKDSRERKPAPGLIFRAAAELRLDLAHCAFVGDSLRDLQAAEAAGLRFYAVRSPKSGELPEGIPIHDSLADVASAIINQNENPPQPSP